MNDHHRPSRLFVALLGGGLFGQQDGMDVRQDTSGRDRDSSQQSIQFFIILDGQRNVSRHDAALLVVPGGIAGQFQNFGLLFFFKIQIAVMKTSGKLILRVHRVPRRIQTNDGQIGFFRIVNYGSVKSRSFRFYIFDENFQFAFFQRKEFCFVFQQSH